MRPHAGFGGGTPTPRNDSAASVTMTMPSISVARTTAELTTFGRMWRFMIVRLEQPPDSGPGEHGLDHDGDVDHEHEVDSGERQDGNQRVLERVLADDERLGQ